MNEIEDRGHRLTRAVSNATGWLGSFPAILISFVLVGAWFVGVFFVQDGFSNTNYQLIINTGTTIITFWMVFIIQNTQNRDGRAVQAKLDAILELLSDEHDNPDVKPLVGIEEKPEYVIKKEQERLR